MKNSPVYKQDHKNIINSIYSLNKMSELNQLLLELDHKKNFNEYDYYISKSNYFRLARPRQIQRPTSPDSKGSAASLLHSGRIATAKPAVDEQF